MLIKKNVLVSFLLLIAILGVSIFGFKQQSRTAKINSPDNNIALEVELNDNGQPIYSIGYKGNDIIETSALGLAFKKTELRSSNLEIGSVEKQSADQTYNLITGKADSARDYYNQIKIDFNEKTGDKLHFSLIFRAYNDGVAFRYGVPTQSGTSKFETTSEKTTFRFPANQKIWAANYGGFNTSQESEFSETWVDSLNQQDVIGLPLTIQQENGLTLAITEADLEDYAGMYLGAGEAMHSLQTKLAPLPDSSGVLVRGSVPFKTPWRVVMVGDDPGDLIESNIVTSLNEPSKIKDTSWIEPGKVVFPWWPDFKTDDPTTSGKFNYENQKHYVDFASRYGIEYLEMEPPWYGPEQDVIRKPLDYDITKPIPRLKVFKLIEYAKKKDVKFFIWMHWKSMENQLDEALAAYEKWGAAGIKIDYMNRDDQKMVNFYHKLAQKAAKHHLMVYFHGAYKPTGIRRTWPNVLTREGVLGLEHNKWSKRITPEHNVTLPFTRMLAGPMDYTPGGFNNVTKEQFKVSWSNPMVMGTRAHQLAMYVVYLSPLQMVSDYPGAIAGNPGAEFIKKVPASWDETRYIKGKIGDYIVLARKKGDRWFLGAMTDDSDRQLDITLNFLPEGTYTMTSYSDGEGAGENPKKVDRNTKSVTPKDSITINLASGGGWVARLIPQEK